MLTKISDPEVLGWYTAIVGNMVADERIQTQAKANPTAAQFANGDFRAVLGEMAVRNLNSQHSISDQMLKDPKVFNEVADLLLAVVYEKARMSASAGA